MNYTIKSIESYAKNLIYLNSSCSIETVITEMISKNISYIPIIDNNGKKNVSVYTRKDLFDVLYFKELDYLKNNYKTLKRSKLPEVNSATCINDALLLLNNHSALLLKDENGIFDKIITSKSISQYLQKFSSKHRILEKYETTLRSFFKDPNISKLTLSELHVRVNLEWYNFNFSEKIDKKSINKKFDEIIKFRNDVYHHRLQNENHKGMEYAESLTRLFEKTI